ncbi:MAG: endonuclease/exonuclease/phosphatase family protein [Planctomycetaceae bacterium]|nr:endonuclease/exonuclease/phosphatase family protein [Planctomycetaceae bacterium]
MSFLLLVIFALQRQHAYAGMLALAMVFNATFVLPFYSTKTAVAGGIPLKLIHANVHASNTDYGRLVDFVTAEDPDLLFLQEVTPEWVAGTKELLQDYPYAYAEPRDGNFGIAVYSRIPFDSVQHVDSPPLGYPTIIATVSVHDRQVTMISSHPTIPLGRQYYDWRNEHLDHIVDLVTQTRGKLILIGDFNTSIWDAHLRQLEDSTGLKNVRKGFGVLPTWPAFMPFAMIPIDHALVSEDISVTAVETGRRIGSDHLPLIVTLSL